MNSERVVFSLLALTLSLSHGFSAVAEESPLALGSHFFTLGNYDAAITEYKRFLFFHPADHRTGEMYRNIAQAYRAQGSWQDAITAIRAAMQHASNQDKKSEYRLELAVLFIATQRYDFGRMELIKVVARNPSTSLHRRALFLQAVALIYQFRWDEARKVLHGYTGDEKLNGLLVEAVNLPRKSSKVAKVLSTILPGAGQIYAGNWRSGLNALVLNGLLGFLTVDAVLDRHYVDAATWGGSVFLRYYRGNIFRAEEAVKQFNLQESRRTSEAILQRLQEVADLQQETKCYGLDNFCLVNTTCIMRSHR